MTIADMVSPSAPVPTDRRVRPSLRKTAIASIVLLVSWAPPSAEGQLVPFDADLTRPFAGPDRPDRYDTDPLSDPAVCLTITAEQLEAAAREVPAEEVQTCGRTRTTPD